MKTKTFTLQCSADQAKALTEAITAYTHAAYPAGGSECAQVARETLLESAKIIDADASTDAGAILRKRQRTMLKSAVDWYFSSEESGDIQQKQRLLNLFP